MPNAETIPNNSTSGVISFDILSDGTAIDETIQVISIQVNKTVNRVPFARIVLRDGEAATSEFAISNGSTFEPGKEIEIKIGYDQDNDSVFKGLVVRQKVKVSTSGDTTLTVECRDKAFAMTLGRKNRYFTDVKDSDALEELLGEYGVLDSVEATATTHRELVQFHSTDWDFMLTRAEANSLLALVENGKVKLAKPVISGSPELELNFGGNLLAFEAEIDARYQWKSVKAQAWDTANQALFESSVSSVSFKENGNLSGAQLAEVAAPDDYELRHSGFMDATELQNWAEAAM
ncbi:MAG: Rhs element Vgr protein, partial [Bacteroidota bacterium]